MDGEDKAVACSSEYAKLDLQQQSLRPALKLPVAVGNSGMRVQARQPGWCVGNKRQTSRPADTVHTAIFEAKHLRESGNSCEAGGSSIKEPCGRLGFLSLVLASLALRPGSVLN